jgi:DNA-binding CsgD family transcriptional regulator
MPPSKSRNRCPLPPQQLRALHLYSRGLYRDEIAQVMKVKRDTVTKYTHRACRTLSARHVAHATYLLTCGGWLLPPDLTSAIDQWLASGFTDQGARDRMHIAARALNGGGPDSSPVVHPMHRPMRDLLEHVAADTLTPSKGAGR